MIRFPCLKLIRHFSVIVFWPSFCYVLHRRMAGKPKLRGQKSAPTSRPQQNEKNALSCYVSTVSGAVL